MNLLKIFTYSGIIEVFIIPHIFPCIVSLIPNHIIDMVEFGVSFISELFPRVTVNVDSEVLLRVWKDTDEPLSSTPSITESKNGNNGGSSSNTYTDDKSDSSSNAFDQQPSCEGTNPSSSNTNECEKSWKSKEEDEDCINTSFTASGSSKSQLKKCFDKKIIVAAKPVQVQYPSRYVCTIENNVTSSSDLLDTFCRSCSVEYQVKPPVKDNTNVLTKLTPKPYEIREAADDSHRNPQFCKSCSLEYVTKLVNDKSDEKNQHFENPREFKRSFNTDLATCKLSDLTAKHGFSENLEAKAVYFGDNYKNL